MTVRHYPPGVGRKKVGQRAGYGHGKWLLRNSKRLLQLLRNRLVLLFVLQMAVAIVKLVRAIWSLVHSS